MSDNSEKYKKKPKGKGKWILIPAILLLLAGTYAGISATFFNHFIPGTYINGIDANGKSVDEIINIIQADSENYSLTIEEAGKSLAVINADEVGLKYHVRKEVLQEILDSQNHFLWPMGFFSQVEYMDEDMVSFDVALLKEKISKMSFIEKQPTHFSQNASFKFQNDSFVATDEIYGDEIEFYDFSKKIGNAIMSFKDRVDLEKDNLYLQPRYTKDSEEIKALLAKMNDLLKIKIRYNEGEVVDKSEIANWLDCDARLNIRFDKVAITEYVERISEEFTTIGKPVLFTTTDGQEITVPGGSYGIEVDIEKEVEELLKNLEKGEDVQRNIVYKDNVSDFFERGYGDSYVEVNITGQRIYLYIDGELIIESPMVSGNVMIGNGTDLGAYRVAYKQRNAVLVGEDYRTPVSFWMPFNMGEGFHDATWRGAFGGSIYRGNGSHGCVNLPYKTAQVLYEHIYAGIPVFVFTTDGAPSNIAYMPDNLVPEEPTEEEILAQNQEAADNVINIINTMGPAVLENEMSIIYAREAFNALTPEAQAMVVNAAVLFEAERIIEYERNGGEINPNPEGSAGAEETPAVPPTEAPVEPPAEPIEPAPVQ